MSQHREGEADTGLNMDRESRNPTPEPRSDLRGSAMGEAGILTLVCLRCGTEYYFEDEPPESLSCDKCGNQVFRSFDSNPGDEAAQDFVDATARDLNLDDAEGDTLPGDIIELNSGA